MDARVSILTKIFRKNPSYENWRNLLIAVTHSELVAAGIFRDFKINDEYARKCFESGMSPLMTFRETFEM